MKIGRGTLVAGVATMLAGSVVMASSPRPAGAATVPEIRVGDARVIEGNAGQAVVSVPVDLSAPSTVKVKVNYDVSGLTATAGSDFVPASGTLTFPAGTTDRQVSVVIVGDTVVEPDEFVDVHLSGPINATIADADGTVTILDDDGPGASQGLQVNVGDITVTANPAGTHYASLPVTLSAPSSSTVKVSFSVSCGATQDGIQIRQRGTLSFARGRQSRSLRFRVPLEQSVDEALSFLATLTVQLGSATVNRVQGEGTILGTSVNPTLPVGAVARVSLSSEGAEAQFPPPLPCVSAMGSVSPTISGDGRYVAFVSDATNLVPKDTNHLVDLFVHDNVTGVTERDSVFSDGSQVPADGYNDLNISYPWISGDGRYVTFISQRPLSNDVSGVGGNWVYLHDRATGTTELISRDVDGNPRPGYGWYAPVSDDGRYVFLTSDETLGTGVVQPVYPQSQYGANLFVRDRLLGTTSLVSSSYNGGWTNALLSDITPDGRYVLWRSDSPNFLPGDTNGLTDYFLKDMQTGTIERVNLTDTGQQISGPEAQFPSGMEDGAISTDGRFVVFPSGSPNVVAGGPSSGQGHPYLYLRDRQLGNTTLVPATPSSGAYMPDISGDGSEVGYTWFDSATDLWATSVYDTGSGTTTTVGQLPDGTLPNGEVGGGWSGIKGGWLSRDGSFVAFASDATNLVPQDSNDASDVFVQRLR